MRKFNTNFLQATALSLVLGFGISSGNALAFDKVDWEWDKEINETVNKTSNINVDINPSGELEMEKLQVQIGDVTATSTINGIQNNPPADFSNGGTVSISTPIELEAQFDDNQAGNPITSVNILSNPNVSASNGGGNVDSNTETVFMTFDLEGEFEVDPSEVATLDAVDLPQMYSVATAVGNNQNIESSVALQLHDGQFLFGGFAAESTGPDGNLQNLAAVVNNIPDTGNTHTTAAAALTLGGALGLITPASVSANSTVYDILNASVDSTATAVGNNMNATLDAFTADDALVMADITQYGYADINATSSVYDISVNNYANLGGVNMGPLGDPQIPLVSSVATAVGNNFAIKVSSPSVP